MLFSSNPRPRVTQPLSSEDEGTEDPAPIHTAAPNAFYSGAVQGGTATVPTISQIRQSSVPITSMKLPIVIPASLKKKPIFPQRLPPRRQRPFVLPGVLLGSLVLFIIASLFVIPLDSSQQPRTIAQTIGDLFSAGRLSAINTMQQHDALPQTLLSGEGACGGIDIWSTCATIVTASGVMGTGQMQRPIKGAIITQVFGHWEYQFWCGCWKPHTGIDLAAPYGSPIMAADSGQVIWTGWDWSGLGWAVKINHGHYIATIYGHLERFIVRVGENVTQGQVIGYEGSTGASTGPHVHFMVLYQNVWVDPMNYVQLP